MNVGSPGPGTSALAIDSTDVFLDIGSGRGNLVLACARLQPPPLLSCGIEILAPRHEMAQAAAVAGAATALAAASKLSEC